MLPTMKLYSNHFTFLKLEYLMKMQRWYHKPGGHFKTVHIRVYTARKKSWKSKGKVGHQRPQINVLSDNWEAGPVCWPVLQMDNHHHTLTTGHLKTACSITAMYVISVLKRRDCIRRGLVSLGLKKTPRQTPWERKQMVRKKSICQWSYYMARGSVVKLDPRTHTGHVCRSIITPLWLCSWHLSKR